MTLPDGNVIALFGGRVKFPAGGKVRKRMQIR